MFRTWTRRRMTSAPPDSGPRFTRVYAAAALLLAVLLPSCRRSDKNENRISPILVNLDIQNPYTGSPDPAVYVQRVSTTGDLVTIDVKLRAGAAPISFDTFTLEFTYDFKVVQIGDVFDVNPDVLGSCSAGLVCDPLCLNNAAQSNQGLTVDASGKAHFIMGVSAKSGCPPAKTGRCKAINMTTCTTDPDCPHDTCDMGAMQCKVTKKSCTQDTDCSLAESCDNGSGLCRSTDTHCTDDAECIVGESCVLVPDTTLVTLAFIAATTIDPPGSRIELYTNPDPSQRGDCEILNSLVDLGIPCVDGNATMTATR